MFKKVALEVTNKFKEIRSQINEEECKTNRKRERISREGPTDIVIRNIELNVMKQANIDEIDMENKLHEHIEEVNEEEKEEEQLNIGNKKIESELMGIEKYRTEVGIDDDEDMKKNTRKASKIVVMYLAVTGLVALVYAVTFLPITMSIVAINKNRITEMTGEWLVQIGMKLNLISLSKSITIANAISSILKMVMCTIFDAVMRELIEADGVREIATIVHDTIIRILAITFRSKQSSQSKTKE